MIRNSKDFEDALEYYLESQKQKHYREGALCTLGYILVGSILEAQKEEEVMLPAESHTNYEKNNNADNSAQTSSGTKTECVGTYPVSGYTRADGTEVSGYTRSCGAAHNGKSKPEKAEPIEEPDYFAENEGYDVLEGRVEKNEDVENEPQKENNTGSQKPSVNTSKPSPNKQINNTKKENELQYTSEVFGEISNVDNLELDRIERWQKQVAQNKYGNILVPLKDYYKISLDLADKPDNVKSNERYQVYKVSDLPADFDKNVVYQKIARGMNIDFSSEGRKNLFKDVRVVIPRDNSKLVELIKKSDEMKAILKRENDNILDGKYKNEYLPGGVEFKKPAGIDLGDEQWRDKATLFGVIHNADIYNIRKSNDGSINLTISDFYDFENWKINDSDSNSNKFTKFLNNNADAQQRAGKLTPYVLYIPVKFTQKELEELMKAKIN